MHDNGMMSSLSSLIFRPTPSRPFSSICLLELIPRPRAEGGAGYGWFAVAGGVPICLLTACSCRSLAIARSLVAARFVLR